MTRTRAMVGAICAAAVGLAASRASAQRDDGARARPAPGPTPSVHLPTLQVRRLANGLTVVVLESHALPLVVVQVQMDVAAERDPQGKEGLGAVTAAMMSEGTATRSADALADASAALGSSVWPTGFVTVTSNLDASLGLMADQLLHPAFPAAALERERTNRVARLVRARENPSYLAERVFATVVYGKGHPYARTETEASVRGITRDDLVAFHREYYRPRNAVVIVAGDVTVDSAVAKVGRVLGAWPAGGHPGRVPLVAPAGMEATRIYLYDRPGSAQSVIVVGQMGPRRDDPAYDALELFNIVLGGAFNSRLNLSLREAHGWTYGASSRYAYRPAPELGTFELSTDVVTEKTDSAVAEIVAQIRAIGGERPVADSELKFARRAETQSLPLRLATVEDVAGAAAGIFGEHLPLDYYDHYVARVDAVTVGDVGRAVARWFDPARMAIVVVGDRARIEDGLRAAHVGPIINVPQRLVPDGEPRAVGAAAGTQGPTRKEP